MARQRQIPVQAALEPAKWLAIVAMTIDHANTILFASAFPLAYAIGRIAFPLFVWLIAYRLSLAPELAPRYLKRLGLWALLSQPIYSFALDESWHSLNILFTLWLGVAAAEAWRRSLDGDRPLTFLFFGLICIGLGVAVDYGPFGVAMLPLLSIMARGLPLGAAALSGLAGWGANFNATVGFTVASSTALLASLVAVLCLRTQSRWPRLPGPAFYAFYPVHLAILAFVRAL